MRIKYSIIFVSDMARSVAWLKNSDAERALDRHGRHGDGYRPRDSVRIVRHLFEASNSTTVQRKDRDSGPQGMLPFVHGLLGGLA